jgi:chromosome partitioning protein
MKTIASASQKGGCGKTFICLHSAGVLAEQGKRVLLCDMDQQGNLSSVFFDSIYRIEKTIDDILSDQPTIAISEVIQSTHIENIHILPCNINLSNLDVRLAGDYDAQTYLAEALQEVKDEFDYIFIDCPPSLGLPTRMALVAAEGVVIPIEAHEWALMGGVKLVEIINQVQKRANPKLRLLGLLINRFKGQRVVEREYRQALLDQFEDAIFVTQFGDHVQYVEAITEKSPITHYLPKSDQANIFRNFVKELISRGEKIYG